MVGLTSNLVEGVERVLYPDLDNDGFYLNTIGPVSGFCIPSSYAAEMGDCDDNNAAINPSANEICGNTIDDNCNTIVDEGCFGNLMFNLKAIIEGYELPGGLMQPVLFNTGITSNSSLADTIIVELRDQFSPGTIISSDQTILSTNGFATVNYPLNIIGGTYWIVLRQRNSIETWSGFPVTLSGSSVFYDFTAP